MTHILEDITDDQLTVALLAALDFRPMEDLQPMLDQGQFAKMGEAEHQGSCIEGGEGKCFRCHYDNMKKRAPIFRAFLNQ